MDITHVCIRLSDHEKLKGFASITLDDQIVIRGLKVIRGGKGYFVAMPNRRVRRGAYLDVAYPITNDFRLDIERIVLDKYWETIKRNYSQRRA
jgi:stage V sporulation protein G